MHAEKASCHHKLPELMQGCTSPDTSHAQHAQHGAHQLREFHAGASQQHMLQASVTHRVQTTGSGQENLQHELSFSHNQTPASGAACCLRCGVKSGQEGHDCRFHPALLQDPGPFLYSPEWHACRAAKHGARSHGCFVREGHYFPGHAVQATGLAQACAAGCKPSSSAVHEQLQPRTRLPFPAQKK